MQGTIMSLGEARFDRKTTAYWFIFAYVVSFILSKYYGLLPAYALDDYTIVSGVGADSLPIQFLSQGRFSFALIQYLLVASHLTMLDLQTIALIGMALFGGLMFSIALPIFEEDSRYLVTCVALMLGTQPYLAEYVSFRQAALPMAIMYLALWLSFRSYRTWKRDVKRNRIHPILAIVLAVLAIGTNQLALSFFCMGIVYIEAREILAIPGRFKKYWWKPFIVAAIAGAITSFFYFLSAYFAREVFVVGTNDRATLLAESGIPQRIAQLGELFLHITVANEPIVSSQSKLLLLLGIAALLLLALVARFWQAVYAMLVFCIAICLALFPIAISSVWWPAPRTLIAVPFAFAGTILILQGKDMRRWIVPVTMPIVLASLLFAGHSNAVLANQLRINRWDLSTARAIYIAASERFPEAKGGIVLDNPRWAYPAAPNAADMDLNVSALSIGWAVKPLFREATGRIIDVQISTRFNADCAKVGVFPSRDAIFQYKDEVVVCM